VFAVAGDELRLVLLLDKSEPWLNYTRKQVLSSWEVDSDDDVTVAENLSVVGTPDLFGETPVCTMSLTEVEQVKSLASDLETLVKDGSLADRMSAGLVIMCSVNRNSTKKLESLVSRNGGRVITTKETSKDRSPAALRMLKSLSIPSDVKSFLVDYAGDDYSLVIPLIEELASVSPRQQRLVTLDKIELRLAKSAGSLTPWQIEKPLLKDNDPDETIKVFRRIVKHSHPLLVLRVLKNKMHLAYRVSALMDAGVTDLRQIADCLGVANNYPLRLAHDFAKKFGMAQCQWFLEQILDAESKAMGASSADPVVHAEMTLARMCSRMRSVRRSRRSR
jgi:DNA polymerase III delta subunit